MSLNWMCPTTAAGASPLPSFVQSMDGVLSSSVKMFLMARLAFAASGIMVFDWPSPVALHTHTRPPAARTPEHQSHT